MKLWEKIQVAVSIIAAAGVFGVCFVLYENEALPPGIRITVAVLGLVNLVCAIMAMQEKVKRGRKRPAQAQREQTRLTCLLFFCKNREAPRTGSLTIVAGAGSSILSSGFHLGQALCFLPFFRPVSQKMPVTR